MIISIDAEKVNITLLKTLTKVNIFMIIKLST